MNRYVNMYPSQTNPQGTPTNSTKPEFENLLDEISAFLHDGFHWHKRVANQCRKIAIRGWGRIHDQQSKCDAEELIDFEKLLMDKLNYAPTEYPNKESHIYNINTLDDFKQHHIDWIKRETAIIPTFNKAINEARSIDIEVYEKLCCILKRVQGEKMRVHMLYDRLEMAGWNTHDIGVCSKWLHEQAENGDISGHDINSNIG